MKTKARKFNSIEELGLAIGLSEIDMALIKQKKKVIEKLKSSRIKQGLSQAALAKLIGSSQPAIARMESGIVSEVSMDFLCKAAFALKVDVIVRAPAA